MSEVIEVMKWAQLFDHLYEKCNFHKDDEGKARWTCHGDLRFTEEFCAMYDVNFKLVKSVLEGFGGYCDCECIFNAEDHIDPERRLPQFEFP